MLASKYIAFAVIATAANLLSQCLTLVSLQTSFLKYHMSLVLAMLLGTAVGLVVKYYLDKKYIFYYQTRGGLENAKKFSQYSLVGIITTSVFWGFELAFEFAFESAYAKYVGAAIGLAIGYTLKYHIDKRFVFNKQDENRI